MIHTKLKSTMIDRDKNFIKQIKASLVFKILAILMSFLLVRYMLDYLGVEQYGIWSVILSIMSWILYFDLGIAHGVKNKVAESLALNQTEDANEYISTSYIILTFFAFLIFSFFFIISSFIDWQRIFNIYTIPNEQLLTILRVVFFFILLNFILSIITSVFNAVQKASLIVVNQFISNLLSLIMILLLLKFTTPNLLYLAISYGLVSVSSNLILSLWFFKKFHALSPKLNSFNLTKVRSVFSLGMNFFLLQITFFFMIITDKIIITHLLGASFVTSYDILYKYFGAILIIHGLINTPLWPMYTEAYIKNDHVWISKTLVRMVKLCIIYIGVLCAMIIIADFVIHFWLDNDSIKFLFSNYIYMSVMLLFFAWHSIFASFTNGIEKTKVQFFTTMIGALINIPLSIIFVKYFNMGLNGILLATIISLSIFGIFGPIQAIKEIKLMKAHG